jgi:hypothetical protein
VEVPAEPLKLGRHGHEVGVVDLELLDAEREE